MRIATLNAFMGALGLATLVAAAPLDAPDTCVPSTTTLFVTMKPSTITVYDASASTLYITVQKSAAAGHVNATPLLSIPASSSDEIISYVAIGTSTAYLNGQTPTGAVLYATSVATLTVEPVLSLKSADPAERSTSSGMITVTLTEHRTVTGFLQAPGFSTLSTNPTFTGIASGGWNETSGVGYTTGRGPTYAVPSGIIPTGMSSHVAADTVSTALAAQTGFGGADPASLSINDPTIDYSATYLALSLSTMFAKSGFNAFTTPYTDITKTTPKSSTSEAAQPNATFVTAPSRASFVTAPTQVVGNSTVAIPSSAPSSAVFTSASNVTASLSTSASSASVTGLDSTAAASTSVPSSTVAINDPSTAFPQSTSLSSTATPTLGLNQSSTGVSSQPIPSASACGKVGDFVLNFDDIPPLSIGNQSADTVDPAPVFSPYHQFDFSNGFVVVPPPTDPYLPSSGKQLTEFIPNFTVVNSTTLSGPNSAQEGFSADIGNGDHDRNGCFRFNFYGGSVGCDSKGPSCLFTFTGLRLDKTTSKIKEVASASMAVDACPSLKNCKLTPVDLGTQFKDLTVIRMNLTVGGEPKIWWMDDIRMGWTDNSCETGLCRINSHIHKRQLQLART